MRGGGSDREVGWPGATELSRTEPSRTEPNRTEPNQNQNQNQNRSSVGALANVVAGGVVVAGHEDLAVGAGDSGAADVSGGLPHHLRVVSAGVVEPAGVGGVVVPPPAQSLTASTGDQGLPLPQNMFSPYGPPEWWSRQSPYAAFWLAHHCA